MYAKTLKTLGLTLSLGVMGGCIGNDPLYNQFNAEAGSLINTSGFATQHNIRVMTEADYFSHELAQRFAREVPTTINFALDSATLDVGEQDILRSQINWIKKFPELKFRVFGHTDLTGPSAHNKSLGMKRALAVVKFFEQNGISRQRLQAAISYGEERPVFKTETEDRRNRRTVTEVIGFYEKHKSVIDGRYAQIAYRAYLR